MTLAIETKDLAKEYGDLRALAGLDLEVGAGEFFGLLGPNGTGKTTFINVLVRRGAGGGGVSTDVGGRGVCRRPGTAEREAEREVSVQRRAGLAALLQREVLGTSAARGTRSCRR